MSSPVSFTKPTCEVASDAFDGDACPGCWRNRGHVQAASAIGLTLSATIGFVGIHDGFTAPWAALARLEKPGSPISATSTTTERANHFPATRSMSTDVEMIRKTSCSTSPHPKDASPRSGIRVF